MKIGIMGCNGRMGQMLVKTVLENTNTQLSGGTVPSGHKDENKDIGLILGGTELGTSATSDAESLISASDAVINFTAPDYTLDISALCAAHKTAHIIGTTGLSDAQEATLAEHAKDTAIVYAANMSIGVNILSGLVKQAAKILDDRYDIEIVEMHHKHKVDAPSGTALALGKAAAEGRNIDLQQNAVMERSGHTGERETGSIGFATLRGGTVIGDHTVLFAGDKERVELRHIAEDRSIFANGAVEAAIWAHTQQPGLYSMQDVLGLS